MKRSKKQRKEWKRQQKEAKRAEHLKREDFHSDLEYENWWKLQIESRKSMKDQIKQKEPVAHNESVDVPWKWELRLLDPITAKPQRLSHDPFHPKKDGETLSLYAQGGVIFLCRDGTTQKLTAMHTIFITEAGSGKVIKTNPQQLAAWTVQNMNKYRKDPKNRG